MSVLKTCLTCEQVFPAGLLNNFGRCERCEKGLKPDPVNHPSHYKTGGIETIDFLEAKLGDGFEDYCVGNILKYLTRYKHKNGLEDLQKAAWYLERVVTWKEEHKNA